MKSDDPADGGSSESKSPVETKEAGPMQTWLRNPVDCHLNVMGRAPVLVRGRKVPWRTKTIYPGDFEIEIETSSSGSHQTLVDASMYIEIADTEVKRITLGEYAYLWIVAISKMTEEQRKKAMHRDGYSECKICRKRDLDKPIMRLRLGYRCFDCIWVVIKDKSQGEAEKIIHAHDESEGQYNREDYLLKC
jgi:hypothetical protein